MLDRSGDGVLGLADLKACVKEKCLSREDSEALGKQRLTKLFLGVLLVRQLLQLLGGGALCRF